MRDALPFPVPRAAFAAAAFATSAVLLVALAAAFHDASSLPWLRDTPLARGALARCEALPSRAERHDCMKSVAIAARERDAGARWQAAGASAAEPGARR